MSSPKDPSGRSRWLAHPWWAGIAAILTLFGVIIAILQLTQGIAKVESQRNSSEPALNPSTSSQEPRPITTLTPVATPTPSSTEPEPSVSPSMTKGPIEYLADLNAVDGSAWSGSLTISGTDYPRSLLMYCIDSETSVRYSVVGKSRFKATIGIPDGTRTLDKAATVRFFAEGQRKIGPTLRVRLGQPKDVSFDLKSATQLEIRCSHGVSGGLTFGVGFGEAIITP